MADFIPLGDDYKSGYLLFGIDVLHFLVHQVWIYSLLDVISLKTIYQMKYSENVYVSFSAYVRFEILT